MSKEMGNRNNRRGNNYAQNQGYYSQGGYPQNQGYYQNQGFQAPFVGNQGNNNTQFQYKRSGATYTKIKKGKNEGLYCVNAWRKTRTGLMIASAFPAGGEEYESGKGNRFRKYAVEISNRDAGTHQVYWALMNLETQMIFIKELGLVISPNGRGYSKNGKPVFGYFGKV